MSRPVKDTIDYFSHDVKHGKTMRILQNKFGNDGYAVWFKTLELLGSSNGHYYDFNDVLDREDMVAYYGVDEGLCMQILGLLSTLKKIDPELFERKILWSDTFIERLKPVYARRKQSSPEKPSTETELMSTETDKGKERKGKESKKELSDDSLKLAHELANFILSNKPDYFHLQEKRREKTVRTFADEIDKMLRLDKRKVSDVQSVIKWSQNDSFWKSNILSGSKLREKFDQLQMAMNRHYKLQKEEYPELL